MLQTEVQFMVSAHELPNELKILESKTINNFQALSSIKAISLSPYEQLVWQKTIKMVPIK